MNARTRSAASRRPLVAAAALLAALPLLGATCKTTLISSYDEPTDRALTELAHTTDDFLALMIARAPSPENAFEVNRKFYEDADRQLRRLEFRVGSIPDNSHTVKIVKQIRETILGEGKCSAEGASLRDLHCTPANLAQGPSRVALTGMQQSINSTIHAALALELAKRQGGPSANP